MRYQLITQAGTREYNQYRNYNVNDVVSLNGKIYQNTTGVQGNPETDNINWINISSSGNLITSETAIFQDLASNNGYKSNISTGKNIILCNNNFRLLNENIDFTYNSLTGEIELIGDFKNQVIANSVDFSPMTLNFKLQ